MARFSLQTEQILRSAGWFPGRQVRDLVTSWKGEVMLSEFQMFPSAERVLLEFGGLKVDQNGPGETCAREPFAVDPTLAAYEGDRFSELSPLVSTNLYPLGEAFGGNYYWVIGENDQLYILMDDIQLLGKNTNEALENLIVGRMPPKIA
jgi:SUKH-3 immunity protein of toxin-antitoxin system